jgi:conjugative transposon TraM protein
MSSENEGSERKPDVAEIKKEDKPKKELTPQEIQKRKKMLVYPLFFLLFAGVMWLIFAPSGDKDEKQPDGFNSELPIPKDEAIVGDKRTAYEQEAMRNKTEEKRRSLQDFAYMLGEEENNNKVNIAPVSPDYEESPNRSAIQSSANAYKDVNRQINSWYEQPATNVNEQAQAEMESRIEELERKLTEAEAVKSAEDKQLELIEKSYQIAAKYTPMTQGQAVSNEAVNEINMREKVIPKPVSQVHHNVVSLLAAPLNNDEFLEQYSKPRNMGFITAAGNETVTDKNSISACVYQTIKLSDGKEMQLRLLEPMRAGHITIPANTIVTGSAKIGGERLHVTINSIHYDGNVIPVELAVYDLDGISGFSAPNSDELNAAKEIAANMGTQMGSSITITDDAGSQFAADLGRSAIQGVSQYIGKKMRKVEVTLKANHKVLLLPKT